MARLALGITGLVLLASLWLGPLPELAQRGFAAHMTLHMGVVAVTAPLIALGLASGRLDPVLRWPGPFAPVPASGVELAVVWAWHAPALHAAARAEAWAFALEQASFLAVGMLLWLSVLGGPESRRIERAGPAALGLLLTSMHMTLLGALLALAPRPLYAHAAATPFGLTPLEDQHLGGAVMLGVGGAVYLLAGVSIVTRLLRRVPAPGEAGSPA
jgi:putative membrane protein